MDERKQMIFMRGAVITLVLVYLSIFISAIWKYVQTADITNSTWEIIFIVLIPASILWFSREDESLMLPKLASGESVPTSSDKEAKQKRRIAYFWNTVAFTIIILTLTVLDAIFIQKEWSHFTFSATWSGQMNITVTFILEFIITFVTFFAIIYVWGEWNVRRYERKMDELDNANE